MAGEYYRWLARDVKPEEPVRPDPEQVRRERRARMKWVTLAALVCAVLAGDFVYDLLHRGQNEPDLHIAYVGSHAMPAGAAEAVEALFSGLCRDVSGNGRVEAALHEYIVPKNDPTEEILTGQHIAMAQGASMALLGDLDAVTSTIFLLEDPEWFQEEFQILARADGTLPEDTPDSDVPMSFAWAECPALEQAIPGVGLYVARRGFWNGERTAQIENALELWQSICPTGQVG